MTESTVRPRGGFGAFPGRERQVERPRDTESPVGATVPAARPVTVEEPTVTPRSTTRADKTTVLPNGEDA